MLTDVMSVLYELTLFALFVILFMKLCRDYVLPALYQEITAQKQTSDALIQEAELLRDTNKRLIKEKAKQEKHLTTLEKKIRTWHSAQLGRVKKTNEENRIISTQMHERKLIQKQVYHAHCVRREVLPKAIADAKERLTSLLAGKQGIKLLTDLVDDIGLRAKEHVQKR